MLQASGRSYVCWQCTSRRLASSAASPRLDLARKSYQASWNQPLKKTRGFATVQHHQNQDAKSSPRVSAYRAKKLGNQLPIRQRLRHWERDNPDEAQTMLADDPHSGDLSNSLTRPQNVTMAQFDANSPLFQGDELSELRSDDTMLASGDMVELSSDGSRRPMLAVCLGRISGFEHFYTSSGKWFSGLGVNPLFVVPKFAQPSELEAIIAELPAGDIPMEALNALQDLGHGPSRTAGAPLLRKMLDFSQAAEAIYQENAGTLDSSSGFIGDAVEHRYLDLYEIAELLLPSTAKENNKFSATALYAVHRAILQDEMFFRPLKQTGHRRSYLFEVSPLSEVRIIKRVESLVRDYVETTPENRRGKSRKGDPDTLVEFIETARQAIDQSRAHRKPSPHGLIGPSTKPTRPLPKWTATDIEVLQFIELWASYEKFPKYSSLQCLGSAIIRALDRYEDQGFTTTAGWTFLQEVGWIPPWEIQSRYSIRFPGVEVRRGGGFIRHISGEKEKGMVSDVFEGRRQHWDHVTTYCIDAESTTEIDDGVSVERKSDSDQFWIHVHVADPASAIDVESRVAKYAELIPETVYLQGHYSRMLPPGVGADEFSLGKNRPCLTISALVNSQGDLLGRKITPGRLGNVVFITPEAVNIALGETRKDPQWSSEQLTVGLMIQQTSPARALTQPDQLSAGQKDDLALLSKLGKAIQRQRLQKGATPFYQPRAEPRVYLQPTEQTALENGFISVVGDPAITVGFPQNQGTDLVENSMRLAGEVAAQWCNERGVPILYRSQPHATQNASLIHQYTRKVFYPLLEAGVRPSDNQWRHLGALLGGDEISTTPGPHFTMGVDMYTKATSPLCRFGDLIVHWQIEAAILEEMKRGKSLVGNKDDSFLPFDRAKLDRMLPMLRVREKQIRALNNAQGAEQWVLQALVRAWKFNEAPLPETFKFTVAHVAGRSSIVGRLDWFHRQAWLRPDAMNGVSKMADVRLGDVFKVKLKDVNVPANQVLVEAIELLERDEGKVAASALEEQQVAAAAAGSPNADALTA
ncbi:mitochondrial exoribonuclease Cyt-4 [Apiospora phragmitis]|uniref:Mitochondrial exoribonuclease Cyt-4 n=1 Tax=Apiospora phragmitis TaxID=2905665 RepID=A0ABR1TQA1_9PEZI